MDSLRIHGFWGLLFLLGAFGVQAQSPVEAEVERDFVRFQAAKIFLEAHRPDIESRLKTNLAELNRGFERTIPIDRPVLDILGRESGTKFIEQAKTQILDLFSAEEDKAEINLILEDLENRVRYWRLRHGIEVKILPNVQKLILETQPATKQRALADFQVRVFGNPEVEIVDQTRIQLVEINPQSGEERVLPHGIDASKVLTPNQKLKLLPIEFKLSGSVIDSLDPQSPFGIEINDWESNFAKALLDRKEMEETVARAIQEPLFREAFQMIAESELGQRLLKKQGTQSEPSMLEAGLKRFLDQKSVDLIVWLEDRPGKSPKFHLSPADKAETFLEMAAVESEGRLITRAQTTVPLKGRSLDIEVDAEGKSAAVSFVAPENFAPRLLLGRSQLPKSLMGSVDDPLMQQILNELYDLVLFENESLEVIPHFKVRGGQAECSADLGWKDGAPQWNLSSVDVDLCLLDETTLEFIELSAIGGEKIILDFKSKEPILNQFLRQGLAIAKAHEKILGDQVFSKLEPLLLREIESKIVGRPQKNSPQFAGDPSFVRLIKSFDLKKSGDLKLNIKASTPRKPTWQEIIDFPKVDGMPSMLTAQLANQVGLMDIEVELTLPPELEIQLQKIKSPEGGVSQINFGAHAEGAPPKIKMTWRVIQEASGAGLMAIPIGADFSEVEEKYQIPQSGPGAPEIGYVQASGIKGSLANGVRGASMLWNWAIRPQLKLERLGLGGIATDAVITSGSAGAVAKVREEEVSVVEKLLRTEFPAAKKEIQREVIQMMWDELNGDVAARLAEVRRFEAPNIFLDDKPKRQTIPEVPLERMMNLNRGLLGSATMRFSQKLKEFENVLPIHKGVGTLQIDGESLREIANQEGRDIVVRTLGSLPDGVEEVSEVIGNQKLQHLTHSLKGPFVEKAERIVAENAKQIDSGIIDFIRFGSSSSAPLDEIVAQINQQFNALMTSRSQLATDVVYHPTYCGLSLTRGKTDQGKEFYSFFANFDELTGPQPSALAARPSSAPALTIVSEKLDTNGAFTMGLSTEFLESIANDRRNLDRLERMIETEAKKKAFVNENFKLKIHRVRIGMTAEGQPISRIAFNVSQAPDTGEKILGFLGILIDGPLSLIFGEEAKPFKGLGSLLDRVSDFAFEIDGDVELEVPFSFSMGDRMDAQSGKHMGHYMGAWTNPAHFKVRHKEMKWGNLFEDVAFDRAEEEARTFDWDTAIDKPFSIPGYEDLLTFRLGRDFGSPASHQPWALLPTSVDLREGSDGLYQGQFLIRTRIDIKNPSQPWPIFEVTP